MHWEELRRLGPQWLPKKTSVITRHRYLQVPSHLCGGADSGCEGASYACHMWRMPSSPSAPALHDLLELRLLARPLRDRVHPNRTHLLVHALLGHTRQYIEVWGQTRSCYMRNVTFKERRLQNQTQNSIDHRKCSYENRRRKNDLRFQISQMCRLLGRSELGFVKKVGVRRIP